MNNPYFSLLKTVWHYGKPWRKGIVCYYVAFILAQVALSLTPYAFGRTIDILQHFTPDQFSAVIYWLLAGIVVLLLFWAFHGPARVKERNVALHIQQSFRTEIYKKLTQLPLRWHQEHHSGDIISRVNRSSLALFNFASEQFIYIEIIIKFMVSTAFLLWISLPVGLLSLITCVLAVTIVLLFDKQLIPLYHKENQIDNRIGAVLFDYLSNMTTILTLRLGELTSQNLYQRIIKVWPFYKKEVVLNEVKWFCMGVILSSMQSLVLIIYILHSLHTTHAIMIGAVVMIFRYQSDLSDVFYYLSSQYSELVRMHTDVAGIDTILDDMDRLAHEPAGSDTALQWHQLTISNLIFNHIEAGNKSRSIFNGLNLTIKRGEKIALIGLSGGGKSTLLNLLRGVYIPNHVSLTIDDVHFDSLEPLQNITTLIPQDPELFENTINFNITMDVEVDLSEIMKAITLAQFDIVLAALPLGLDTDIREKGMNFSVGQKQRLALARGLFAARYSSLILMDEPTSSVDLQTEQDIFSGIIAEFPDSTIIVSLHRLHLLPSFDRIIMLQDGKVIANDLSDKLLNEPGPVKDLWMSYINY